MRTSVDRSFNQHEKMAAFRGRVLVMHTRNYDLLSLSHAERIFRGAGNIHAITHKEHYTWQ